MRGNDDIIQLEQRRTFSRLFFENVERRRFHLTAFQRVVKRFLIDDPAARDVDQPHSLFHFSDRFGVDHIGGLFGLGNVKSDKVRLGVNGVIGGEFDAEIFRVFFGDKRVGGEDVHSHPEGIGGDPAADLAEADHAKRLVKDLDPFERFFVPDAGLQFTVRLRDHPRHGEEHRPGVFGGGDGVPFGGIDDDHAVLGGGREVDVVDPYPGAADDLQVLSRFDDLRGSSRLGTDDQGVVLGNNFYQFIFRQTGLRINLKPGVP